jgi:hypothetical protein
MTQAAQNHHRLNGSAMLVGKEVTMPINALIHVLALLRKLHLHMPLTVEPILFLLLPSKTVTLRCYYSSYSTSTVAHTILIQWLL